MIKEPYVAVQEATLDKIPKGEWVNISVQRNPQGAKMSVESQESPFKSEMQTYQCGSTQTCAMELKTGQSCYGGCEPYENYLKAQKEKQNA